MRKCPECKRVYDDESLNYCLDDGAALLYGAASVNEPLTAILPYEPPSEAPTRHQFISDTAQPEVERTRDTATSLWVRNKIPLAVLIPIVVLAAGFLVYRYFPTVNSRHIESIAVMPFVNASGNSDIEYLSDGITETLIGSLSQLSGLSVKAPSSVFRYKGKGVGAQTVGRELNVQAS